MILPEIIIFPERNNPEWAMTELAPPLTKSVPNGASRRYAGYNSVSVRRHNRSVVLQAILHHGPTSRAHLTQLTGRTPATISSLVGELLEEGIVEETGRNGRASAGRPRITIEFAPGGAHAVGVHLGVEEIAIGLVSPRGQICHEDTFRRPSLLGPAETCGLVGEAVERLLAAAAVPRDRVVGVGVGITGLIDPVQGRVIQSVDMGWQDVAVAAPLQRELNLPVHVGNNVQAMALAESWFGAHKDVADLALLYVGTTVGVGLVIGGRLLGGAGWGAGQIGHGPLAHHAGTVRCSCGNIGCLETIVSQRAIRAEAGRLGIAAPDPNTASWATQPDPVDLLIDHGLGGDAAAVEVLARAGETLGLAVAQVVNLFNPPLVLFAGRLARAGELMLGPMRRCAAGTALPLLVEQTRIEAASLGFQGRIVGPAAIALVECFFTPGQLHYVYH